MGIYLLRSFRLALVHAPFFPPMYYIVAFESEYKRISRSKCRVILWAIVMIPEL